MPPERAPDLVCRSTWNQLLSDLDRGALLAWIDARMGERLRRVYQPEDVLQDALLCAWRDRDGVRWQGAGAFRNWLLTVAERRLLDLVRRERAHKRGGERTELRFSELQDDGETRDRALELVDEVTPLQEAARDEEAWVMRGLLDELPRRYRDVLRLRVFEEHTVEECARSLGLGVSAVKHRFRSGSALYLERLATRLRTAG